jgi:hypothetical protein
MAINRTSQVERSMLPNRETPDCVKVQEHWRRPFEVPAPQAADSFQELQMESGTRINKFASAHDLFEVRKKWVRR